MFRLASNFSTGDAGSVVRRHAIAFRDEFIRNLPLAGVLLIYGIAVVIAGGDAWGMAVDTLRLLGDFCIYGLFSALVLQTYICLFVTRPRSPIKSLLALSAKAVSGSDLGRWLSFLSLFALLATAFSTFKPTISTRAGGFVWDPMLAEISRMTHFGYLPWQILQPLFGHPWITKLLDINYTLWFPAMWIFVIGMAGFCRDEAHRQRCLLGFALIWIVAGSVVATGFSSAGPCFYGSVVAGPNPFAELTTYLRNVNASIGLTSVDVQGILWRDYASGRPTLGISAMPSMHNAVAGLMVLGCWRIGGWIRLTAIVHAVLVFLGSILLAWHYAIDAYVAWAITLAAWSIAGPATRWWVERRLAIPHKREPALGFA